MVRVIFGEKGAGNSKRIIQMANDSLDQTKGSVVFIDAEGQYLFELKHAIRFIDAGHYRIENPDMFVGFIAGIAAQDFDLETVYVDGFKNYVQCELSELESFFECLSAFSEQHHLELFLSISGQMDELPAFIKPLILAD